jgi:hypothetical protein
VPGQLLYLGLGEPVAEALAVEAIGLGVDGGVVKGCSRGESMLSTSKGSQRRLPVASLRNCTLLPVPQNEAMCGRCSWKWA